LELEIELQSRDDAIEALNKKVANASRDSDDMKSEFIATRALVEQLTGARNVLYCAIVKCLCVGAEARIYLRVGHGCVQANWPTKPLKTMISALSC
jgi:uncharacterized coiled-coil protein SlyX